MARTFLLVWESDLHTTKLFMKPLTTLSTDTLSLNLTKLKVSNKKLLKNSQNSNSSKKIYNNSKNSKHLWYDDA